MAEIRCVITSAMDLFPNAIIVGDDFNWDDVRRAVETVSRDRGLPYESRGAGWRILRKPLSEKRNEPRTSH